MTTVELFVVEMFRPLIAILFLAMAFASDEGKPKWAAFAFTSMLVLTFFVKQVDFLGLIVNQGLYVGMGLAIYFPVGVVYHLIRWYFFCTAVVHAHDDAKKRFLHDNMVPFEDVRLTVIPDDLRQKWKNNRAHLASIYGPMRHTIEQGEPSWPNCANQKSRLFTWLVFWPTSMVWWLFFGPIMELVVDIYWSLVDAKNRHPDDPMRDE